MNKYLIFCCLTLVIWGCKKENPTDDNNGNNNIPAGMFDFLNTASDWKYTMLVKTGHPHTQKGSFYDITLNVFGDSIELFTALQPTVLEHETGFRYASKLSTSTQTTMYGLGINYSGQLVSIDNASEFFIKDESVVSGYIQASLKGGKTGVSLSATHTGGMQWIMTPSGRVFWAGIGLYFKEIGHNYEGRNVTIPTEMHIANGTYMTSSANEFVHALYVNTNGNIIAAVMTQEDINSNLSMVPVNGIADSIDINTTLTVKNSYIVDNMYYYVAIYSVSGKLTLVKYNMTNYNIEPVYKNRSCISEASFVGVSTDGSVYVHKGAASENVRKYTTAGSEQNIPIDVIDTQKDTKNQCHFGGLYVKRNKLYGTVWFWANETDQQQIGVVEYSK